MNSVADTIWQRDALADFARAQDFREFTDDGADTYNFVVGDNKYLVDIEFVDAGIVMAVFRALPIRGEAEKIRLLLRRCNYDQYLPFLVQVGLEGDNTLVLAVHLEQSQANQLIRVFEFICELYADAGL